MALTNDEKRAIRATVAAYLADMKDMGFVINAKPDAVEYYGFLALRLAKKLRLETINKGDPVPTKTLNAMDLRPDLKAAKTAQAKAKAEAKATKAKAKPATRKPRTTTTAKAAKALEASTNALV